MNSMSLIITSFHQRDFTLNCIKGYIKFCPKDFKLTIFVIENSSDISYRDEVLSLGKNIKWFNNNTQYTGAAALADGINFAMKYVEDEYVFLSHNDVCITSEKFYSSLIEKESEGYQLIGMCYDICPHRHNSIIILGCLVKSYIVRSVDLFPLDSTDGGANFECGDRVQIFCKDNNIPYLCFDNTHNNESLRDTLPEPYKSLLYTVIAVDHKSNVIFLHFARGTIKTMGKYSKKGRLTVPQIVDFCNKIIL